MKQSPLLKLVQARGTSVALTTLRPLICRSLLALRSLVTTWLNPDATPPAWMKQKQSSKLYFHLISANLPSYYSWGASRGKKIKKKNKSQQLMQWEVSQNNILFNSAEHRPGWLGEHCCYWTLSCEPLSDNGDITWLQRVFRWTGKGKARDLLHSPASSRG